MKSGRGNGRIRKKKGRKMRRYKVTLTPEEIEE